MRPGARGWNKPCTWRSPRTRPGGKWTSESVRPADPAAGELTLPSHHKHPPIRFRPPEADRLWLLDSAKRKGLPVNRVLAEALAEYREKHDPDKGNER